MRVTVAIVPRLLMTVVRLGGIGGAAKDVGVGTGKGAAKIGKGSAKGIGRLGKKIVGKGNKNKKEPDVAD
jgi:hypothetical protein